MGAGAAIAAPAAAGGNPGVGVSLTGAQISALQKAVAQKASMAGLPKSGPASFYLELATSSSGSVFEANLARGEEAAASAARGAKGSVRSAQDAAFAALTRVAAGSSMLYRTSTVSAGLAVTTDVSNVAKLSTLPGVTAVHLITPKSLDNAGAATLVNAQQVWADLGNTGQGVDIGIIDTGIDYTHADFGGSGSVEEYNAILANEAQPAPAGVFPNAKVVGGTDFVGDAYDGSNIPQPDPNPLDCNGHGSHVGGTAGGYGVSIDGSTYTGPYDASLDLKSLRIGPGMAPESNLWALRVFGCEGSTNVVGAAIEYAADPNGDGVPNDKLDILNLSLGSDFGLPDDADSVIADRASALGIVMVIAAGNAGDTYDIGGSPGNAPRVIGVAASNDGYGVFDGWQITNQPDLFEPDIRPGLRSVLYTGTGDVSGDLTLPVPGDDPTACAPLSGDYTGQFLVIEADGFACGSITKSGNAKAAGAAGFIIVADDDALESGINGDEDIPGILVTASDGQTVEDALAAGEQLTIAFGDSLAGAAQVNDPAQVDTIASFTSRGVRQEGNVKPDLTAPGVTLFSAAVGTGSQGVSESGTSMATPTTAGVSALVKSKYPFLTAEQVKASLMNTAVHDLFTGPNQTGLIYAPNRVGAGRIDAAAALDNTVLAYVTDDPGVVSASFGVVEVDTATVTRTKTIKVKNYGAVTTRTYNVHYQPITVMPGVSYSVDKASVTLAPGAETTVTVTLTAERTKMRKTIDPTVSPTQVDLPRQYVADASGRLEFKSTGDAPTLRVPVHANPKPVSTFTQQAAPTGANSGTVTLSGSAVINGTPGTPGAYTSTVSAFELLGTSGQLPQCAGVQTTGCYQFEGERGVDVKNVGVAATTPFDGAVADSFLYFAVSSYAPVSNPNSILGPTVYIDASGDGVWDYQIFGTRLFDGADITDVPVVIGTDRAGNLLPDNNAPAITFLNGVDGSFDTSVFDTDVQILPFPISALPKITATNPRFRFGVQSTSAYGSVDDVGTRAGAKGTELAASAMSYSVVNPGLVFADPTSSDFPAILSIATNSTKIPVVRNPATYSADRSIGPKGIMLVYPLNATGKRTPTIPVSSAATMTLG